MAFGNTVVTPSFLEYRVLCERPHMYFVIYFDANVSVHLFVCLCMAAKEIVGKWEQRERVKKISFISFE